MDFLRKEYLGINIFGERLVLCGYEFDEEVIHEFDRLFQDVKGIDEANCKNRKNALKKLLRTISKAIGFRLFKPHICFILPEEIINSKDTQRLKNTFIKILSESGWSNIYFIQELLAAAIGSDLPFNKMTETGLYTKNICVYGKRETTIISVILAGGTFLTQVVNSNLTNMDPIYFDEIINKLSDKSILMPKNLMKSSDTRDMKNILKASWEADVKDTIYLIASEQEQADFIHRMSRYVFDAPFGYDTFLRKGLETIISMMRTKK